jgi:hypothetical protein
MMAKQANFEAQLEAFEAEVREKIKQLSAKDSRTRAKAAAWLGEAGDPTAITMLAQTYKNDADASVRDAAAYSLGMFRALEQELDNDSARVEQLLRDVAAGKMGRRVPLRARTMGKVALGMIVAAALVAALAFILPPFLRPLAPATPSGDTVSTDSTTTDASTAPSDAPTGVIGDVTTALDSLSTNVSTLRTQYQAVLGGGSLDCSAALADLTPVTLADADRSSSADLATVVDTINNGQTTFTEARVLFDETCASGAAPDPSAFGGPMGALVQLGVALDAARATLDGLG